MDGTRLWLLFFGVCIALGALGLLVEFSWRRVSYLTRLYILEASSSVLIVLFRLESEWSADSASDWLGLGPAWLSQSVVFTVAVFLTWGLISVLSLVAWVGVRAASTDDRPNFMEDLRHPVLATVLLVLAVVAITTGF